MKTYRERIYKQYARSREQVLAPTTIEGFAPRAAALRYMVHRFFPGDRSAQILDLGCGHGALIYFSRQAGYLNTQGIDVSPEQVAEAKRLGIEGVSEGDLMERLASLPSSSMDMVVAFDVIEHFTKDELLPFVDEVHRVLKPGGRWLIHAPNGDSPFVGAIRYGDFTHEQAFTRASLSQLLLSSNFSRLEFYECAPRPHGFKGFVRVILWSLIRLCLRLWIMAETGDTGRTALLTRNFYTVAFR